MSSHRPELGRQMCVLTEGVCVSFLIKEVQRDGAIKRQDNSFNFKLQIALVWSTSQQDLAVMRAAFALSVCRPLSASFFLFLSLLSTVDGTDNRSLPGDLALKKMIHRVDSSTAQES